MLKYSYTYCMSYKLLDRIKIKRKHLYYLSLYNNNNNNNFHHFIFHGINNLYIF